MGYLRVNNIGKAYKRYPKKWGRLAEWAGLGCQHELKWVLRDVSFEISPGDAVGIIGVNGAGKSTLLKIITGTTKPTTGRVEAGGRISALLELGMGFHPDFTGRQNVYTSGQLQGLRSDEIAAKMEEIEAFAEIGDYIDQPVRTYSSGMHVRLAFSVATAVRSDILIVDEALSVGDTYFQHKSFDRIRQFRDQGTTLLFVSHSPAAVKTLCNRAILLDQAVVLRDGAPDAVFDYYNAMIAVQQAEYEIRQTERIAGKQVTRSGSSEAVIEKVDLIAHGESVRSVRACSSVAIEIFVLAQADLPELTAGIMIRDKLGNDVFGTNTYHQGVPCGELRAGTRARARFELPDLALGVGSYSLTVALHTRDTHLASNFDWWDRSLVFQVVPGNRPISSGVCNLPVAVRWVPREAPTAPDSPMPRIQGTG
jgi:lipopolysaccharide transport system ATP-binding protein